MQTKSPSIFSQNKMYFFGFVLVLFTATLMLIIDGKQASFVSLNTYHPFWLNVFFVNYTFMGDGIFALCLVGLLFYFKKKQYAFAILHSFFISGIVVQLIKNSIGSPRPKLFFEAGQYLYFIDGISLANNSSFPSGHTATAFGIATVLVLVLKNKSWQPHILIAAVLVGYSRIYLAQHFLLDVMVGGLIGCTLGIAAFYFAKNIKAVKISFKKRRLLISFSSSKNTTSLTMQQA
jgi:membrane-associated phospholipid phosphatase